MSNEKVYVIKVNNDFVLEYEEVLIEDVVDVFYSREEMKEMGMKEMGWGWMYREVSLKESRIKEYLNDLVKEMKDSGKKSIELSSLFVDICKSYDLKISKYVGGVRRLNNKLFLYEKKKNSYSKRDVINFVDMGVMLIRKKYGIELDIKNVSYSYDGCVKVVKDLISLDELCSYKGSRFIVEKEWIEMIYNKEGKLFKNEE
jgi:hypothetical protein